MSKNELIFLATAMILAPSHSTYKLDREDGQSNAKSHFDQWFKLLSEKYDQYNK